MARKTSPARQVLYADQPVWSTTLANPYLQGIHAPTIHETTATDLTVEGELPEDLYGAYVRNGPNQVFAPTNLYHWFDGDGMVHAIYFRDGQVQYRGRLIRTRGLADEQRAGQAIWPGIMGPFDFSKPRHYLKDTANTDVVEFNGRLLATWYMCGEPHWLDPVTLDTVGRESLGARYAATVSAHPVVDPRSGELVWFTLGELQPPYMVYGVQGPDGRLLHETPIDLPGPRAPHAINITENYSILHDFPLFHDPDVLRNKGYRVARFHRDLPSRFGIIPRRGDGGEVRWFEFAPGYALHMVNAWEEGDWITMDGCFQPDPTIRKRPEEGELAAMLGYLRMRFHLHRWRMNLRTGETRETPLDDLNVEFPLPDIGRYGEKTRYSYMQYIPVDNETVAFHALVKYDHDNGHREVYDYPDGWFASESPFAPRPAAAAEDDGYVITLATSAAEARSEVWVFDAADIGRGPLARVHLPCRVPSGFHAKWVPGGRIWAAGGSGALN